MSCKVTYTAHFRKEAKRLAKKHVSLKDDLANLIVSLESDPEQGTPLGKGLYKIRLAIGSKGKGKSGGARVITYLLLSDSLVYLTSIYDKAEQDSTETSSLLKILKEEGID